LEPEVFKKNSQIKKKEKNPETEGYLTKAKNHTTMVSTLNLL